MNWYWHVRIHSKTGGYWHAQVMTGRSLMEIDVIQDFYASMTGCKMLLEGMSERPFEGVAMIQEAFNGLWETKDAP